MGEGCGGGPVSTAMVVALRFDIVVLVVAVREKSHENGDQSQKSKYRNSNPSYRPTGIHGWHEVLDYKWKSHIEHES